MMMMITKMTKISFSLFVLLAGMISGSSAFYFCSLAGNQLECDLMNYYCVWDDQTNKCKDDYRFVNLVADVGLGVGDHLDQEGIVVDKKNIGSSWHSGSGDAASDEYDYDYEDEDEDMDEDGGEGEDIGTSSALDLEPKQPNVVSDKRSYLRSN